MIAASLNNYRQSPRKVRLVANLVRGKTAAQAVGILTFLPKRSTGPILALLNSALANAKNNFNIDTNSLFVKEIRVDGGVTMKRSMPRARGTAYRINKRTSHILLTLAPLTDKQVKKAEKNAAKKVAKGSKATAALTSKAVTK